MPLTDDRFVSYAQNLEDVMLWRALSGEVAGGGFYIDVGASDPSLLSVTRAFYDRGWQGVNVEPLPEQAAALRLARPRDVVIEAAMAGAPGRRTFYRVTRSAQTGLSTFDGDEAARQTEAGAQVEDIEVEVTTLAALCRAHAGGPVHFLKIDAEGAEGEVLAGADFAACRPWILVIEATHPLDSTPADTPWEAVLIEAGYKPVWFDGLNRFYLATEHARLERHFRVQPNVFDRYVVHDAPLWDLIAASEALAASRLETIGELEADIVRLNQRHVPDEVEVVETPPPPVQPPPPPPGPLPPVHRSLAKRLALLAYRVVRPVVRPIAWRTRGFLIGEIRAELDGHRIRLDQLIARPVAVAGSGDPALPSAMERLLLTLALEDGRDAGPASLRDAPVGVRPPLSNDGHGR